LSFTSLLELNLKEEKRNLRENKKMLKKIQVQEKKERNRRSQIHSLKEGNYISDKEELKRFLSLSRIFISIKLKLMEGCKLQNLLKNMMFLKIKPNQ